MQYNNDQRIVMTLDAGGTKFNFSAISGNREIVEPRIKSAKKGNLDEVLNVIISGFEEIKSELKEKPLAISFSFPGPADYQNGIIGDLENLPAFKGGVALKPMLEEKFGIPVFINNDGDLFTYGESIAGILPEINARLKEQGHEKQYANLLGVTFGTGFGGGIVTKGQLFTGDNSAAGEINRSRNLLYPETSVEDSVSIRGVQRVFARESGIEWKEAPGTKDIFEIGMGQARGNREAAIRAYEELAIVAGDCIANAITLVDGLVVIGGGMSAAHPLFLQKLVDQMNKSFKPLDREKLDRLELTAFNLENPDGFKTFMKNSEREIQVPFTDRHIKYDPVKRIGVGITRLGTSNAASIGAYAFALDQLDKEA